jgi:ethanolamine utilization protein EutQ (cupin superfamily)
LVEELPSIGARLEIRTMTVTQHDKAALQTVHEVALEVRSGELVTVTDGKRQEWHPGDMWLVPRGARVAFLVSGELAGLRAIYLIRATR